LDGTLRPGDRRGKEVRRVEHLGPGRLERGARARDLGKAVQQLKRESSKGLFVAGVKLPLALAELGLIGRRGADLEEVIALRAGSVLLPRVDPPPTQVILLSRKESMEEETAVVTLPRHYGQYRRVIERSSAVRFGS
jgi:hypothetical protein